MTVEMFETLCIICVVFVGLFGFVFGYFVGFFASK